MLLTFRPIKVWPEGWDPAKPSRPGHPFDSSWTSTLDLLDRELHKLGASDCTLQVAASERDCRLDGQLRADAKVDFPGVILSFTTRKHGTLTYACDAFGPRGYRDSLKGWQSNLRAIALGLEALRKVERYGIANRGQQYAGWAELPTGIALSAAMTVEQAAVFIDTLVEQDWSNEIADDPFFALCLFKDAAKVHHPDQGGDPETFRKLVQAREILEAAS